MEINIMKQIYTFMIMNKKIIALGYLQTRNIPNLCQFYSSNVLRHIRKRPTSICYSKQFLAILPMWREKIRTSPDKCTNLLQTIIDSKRSIMSDHWVTILTINNNYFRYYYSANRMLIVDFVLQNFSLYDFEKKLKRVSL